MREAKQWDVLQHKNQIRRFDSYRDNTPEELARLSYGDLMPLESHQTPEPTDFYVPELLSGSDYMGGSVTVSNHRVFLDQFKDAVQNGIWDVYGGYGTYAVAIRLDALTDDMREVFAGLEDYPLIDENDLSEVEMQAEDESWKLYVASDFRKALIEKFPQLEDSIDTLEDGKLFEIFNKAADESNTYWENETGNSAYIDIERIVKVIEESDIKESN